ncbi:hypothetical protein HPB52_001226 [Rhipicephalus sanguineus]|uniref:HTH CENPB-type domain-containing protein n=1 Tax=Rhipicephalus sanguineus TaxID=34632 RepID=A0A9D4PYE2_RHISA|nr:hypothetical protein HPB52_001226 [Rhipicephalus sanguineus]
MLWLCPANGLMELKFQEAWNKDISSKDELQLWAVRRARDVVENVDTAVFAWFCEQRVNKVPLSEKVLQHKALDFTSILCHDSFKASSGWSSHFKASHDIVAKVISEEAAAVDSMATSMCWKWARFYYNGERGRASRYVLWITVADAVKHPFGHGMENGDIDDMEDGWCFAQHTCQCA